MRTSETAVVIGGAPEAVWAVLTDFPRYPEWSVFIQEIEGPLVVGGRILVTSGLPGQRVSQSSPRIVSAERGRTFSWSGGVGPEGFFATRHEFILDSSAGGATLFVHRQTFTDLLPRLVHSFPVGDQDGFEAFNKALKHRVEGRRPGR